MVLDSYIWSVLPKRHVCSFQCTLTLLKAIEMRKLWLRLSIQMWRYMQDCSSRIIPMLLHLSAFSQVKCFFLGNGGSYARRCLDMSSVTPRLAAVKKLPTDVLYFINAAMATTSFIVRKIIFPSFSGRINGANRSIKWTPKCCCRSGAAGKECPSDHIPKTTFIIARIFFFQEE